jgi:hypothetical protein
VVLGEKILVAESHLALAFGRDPGLAKGNVGEQQRSY